MMTEIVVGCALTILRVVVIMIVKAKVLIELGV